MIKINNLKKAYGKKLVLSIDELTINEHELVGIVGNNGAGKTTMLSLILDLIEPSGGSVKSKDQMVSKSDGWKNYTGSYLKTRIQMLKRWMSWKITLILQMSGVYCPPALLTSPLVSDSLTCSGHGQVRLSLIEFHYSFIF